MATVRIVTDSGVALPPDFIREHRIEVIPHRIRIGSAIYAEDDSFSVEELLEKYRALDRSDVTMLPTVLAADINTILDTYQEVGKETEQIVSIHMSGELSPMWQQARNAAEMMRGRYTIRVMDGLSAAYGQGVLVRLAAEAAADGATVHEIARVLNGAIPHLYASIFSESLHFLERGTQVSASQSMLGTMLGIKAMLMMEEGHIIPLEKVQTREEVVEKLVEFVTEFASIEKLGVMEQAYGDAENDLVERLAESLPELDIERFAYPPSLAAHLGGNVLGVMVYEGTY
ncbi:MAG: DegV family EDD domain-containing protein [Caldilineaceae bacterium]|nr:DegV family EDD domain-containing protein [Caldilineaceae bacterium]